MFCFQFVDFMGSYMLSTIFAVVLYLGIEQPFSILANAIPWKELFSYFKLRRRVVLFLEQGRQRWNAVGTLIRAPLPLTEINLFKRTVLYSVSQGQTSRAVTCAVLNDSALGQCDGRWESGIGNTSTRASVCEERGFSTYTKLLVVRTRVVEIVGQGTSLRYPLDNSGQPIPRMVLKGGQPRCWEIN
uniref:(California timema) hypothetical protein n=1 Tax=Timema californicum TaxID=61474 RepID=A0A7R9JJ71_TIMCA|nr:unnamed protein product [Timema californicum]